MLSPVNLCHASDDWPSPSRAWEALQQQVQRELKTTTWVRGSKQRGADQRPAPGAQRPGARPERTGLCLGHYSRVTSLTYFAHWGLPRPHPRTGLACSRITSLRRAPRAYCIACLSALPHALHLRSYTLVVCTRCCSQQHAAGYWAKYSLSSCTFFTWCSLRRSSTLKKWELRTWNLKQIFNIELWMLGQWHSDRGW